MIEEFNFFRDKKFIDAFRRAKPYLIDLERVVQKIGFGKLTIVLRVHNQQVTDLTVISGQRIRYDLSKKKPPTVEPVETGDIGKELASELGE